MSHDHRRVWRSLSQRQREMLAGAELPVGNPFTGDYPYFIRTRQALRRRGLLGTPQGEDLLAWAADHGYLNPCDCPDRRHRYHVSMRQPVSPAEHRRKQIAELTAAGTPVGLIASQLGVSRRTVYRHLHKSR